MSNLEQDFADHVFLSNTRMDEVVKRIAAIEKEQVDAKVLMAKNTETIQKINKNTADMLDVFNSWKGAMKVLEFIGKVVAPVAAIIGLISAIAGAWFTFFKGGQ